jgi:pimeloyl-ACP methyl ester carboxylesterase
VARTVRPSAFPSGQIFASVKIGKPMQSSSVQLTPSSSPAPEPMGMAHRQSIRGETIRNCGHFQPEEQPEAVVEALGRFFGSI